MTAPGTPSLVLLVYLLFFLPWMAMRSARRLGTGGGERPAGPMPSRSAIWINTLLGLAVLFALATLVGRSFGYEVFAVSRLGGRDYAYAALALGACFAIRALLRTVRTEEERRKLFVYKLVPKTPGERFLKTLAILAAAVAEEAAYRGVLMAILWYSLGNPWLAALISALAFALSHWAQGAKSGVAIFAIALVMQALVALTGTLVLAMAVHALYDFAAGYLIARQAAADERAAGSGANG